ncbi:MAG TPA: hypothetical protein VN922_05630, partial [Bacteroidia bacterium]|nr:hypothetical protein [Bacteroidia bacterium]
MRKPLLSILVATITIANVLVAQTNPTKSTYITCSEFHVTIPLRDMPAQTDSDRINAAANHEKLEEREEAMRPQRVNVKKQPQIPDPVAQKKQGNKILSPPLVNFGGQLTIYSPPDPNGAVGPTQYVQAINTSIRVFNKSGTPLTAAIDLKTIFPGSADDGDPIVLYDKFADRWFISEMKISGTPIGILVAVSKTNDATGAYYTYTFTNAEWSTSYIDQPKYSIWTDGYYMTANYNPEAVVVLDRTRMLAGKQSAGMILTPTPTSPYLLGGGPNNSIANLAKTFDCDASALPAYGTPNYMVFFEDVNSGGASNMIKFYKLTHDTAAKTLTVVKWDSIAPATFNTSFTSTSSTYYDLELTQPGTPNNLDALDGTFNFRVPFISFSGYNSILLSNTVNTGSNVAGIRWYEIRQDPGTQHFSIYQQGTYAPADGASRWNASMAMDKNGNIALE